MKKYLTLTGLLVAGTLCANAADNPSPSIIPPKINLEITPTPSATPGTAVFNFGRQSNESWMDRSKSWNEVIFSTSGNAPEKVTDSTTQLSLQMTQGQMAGTGSYGSFTAESGQSSGPYTITQDLKSLSTGVLGESTYDTLWGGSANAWNKTTGTFTISGLQAGWDYEIYLFSGRANVGSGTSLNGSTQWTIASSDSKTISGVQVSKTTSPATTPNWQSKSVSDPVDFNGRQDGKDSTIVGFKFNAGTAEAITLTSADSSNFTLNGIVIRAIPEPSMFGLLAGISALALVSSRRRRK